MHSFGASLADNLRYNLSKKQVHSAHISLSWTFSARDASVFVTTLRNILNVLLCIHDKWTTATTTTTSGQ